MPDESDEALVPFYALVQFHTAGWRPPDLEIAIVEGRTIYKVDAAAVTREVYLDVVATVQAKATWTIALCQLPDGHGG